MTFDLDRDFYEMRTLSPVDVAQRVKLLYPELYRMASPKPQDVRIVTLKQHALLLEEEHIRRTSNVIEVEPPSPIDNLYYEVCSTIGHKSGFDKEFNKIPYKKRDDIHMEAHRYTLLFEWIVDNREKHFYWFL